MWAKTNGNYQSIQSGSSVEVMDWLLATPVAQYWTETDLGYDGTTSTLTTAAAAAWDLIVPAVNSGYLITAGTQSVEINNYVSNHAYTILNYTTLTNSTGSY